MNILILSCGTRNKVVQYFRECLKDCGRVIATDCSALAPALYDADVHYIVPPMNAATYLDVIYEICKKEQVHGILSLIDPELSLLAAHEHEFQKLGVTVIGSCYDLCEMSLDKYQMYTWLCDKGYRCAKSYMELKEFYRDLDDDLITFPVFVKPARGSASISISKAYDRESVEFMFAREEGLMVQAFLDGQEIGADVYIDMISGKVVSIFTKKKIKMRAGETDKAVSFKDEKLFALIQTFAEEAGYRGQIDIDVFEIDGEYYISEVNPRFGGGYPHAYESGANHIDLIINNLNGIENMCQIGNYRDGTYMMKYNELKVI